MKLSQAGSNSSSAASVAANNILTYSKLAVTALPTTPESVVNKEYVDALLSDSTFNTGELKFSSTPTIPGGFLRCNGSFASKTTYSNLYAKIGNSYSEQFYLGNGKPYISQYGINSNLSTAISYWTQVANLPATNAYSQAIITKNRVYLISRYSGSTYTTPVYTAVINADGTLGAWGIGTPLPTALSNSQVVIVNNIVYILGGYNGTYRSTVYKATINADGTLTSWTAATSLPFTVSRSQVIVTNSRVYIIGGFISGVRSSQVLYATYDNNGKLSSWSSGPSLPVTISDHSVTVIKDKVYVLGGIVDGLESNYTCYGVIDNDGIITSWTSGIPLPETLYQSSIVTSTNRVYLLGGLASTTITDKIYSAIINLDGSLGNWEIYGNLPTVGYGFSTIITASGLYILGGYRSSNTSNRVDFTSAIGGKNDYTSYYLVTNGDNPLYLTNFKLPDYTFLEKSKIYTFIKY